LGWVVEGVVYHRRMRGGRRVPEGGCREGWLALAAMVVVRGQSGSSRVGYVVDRVERRRRGGFGMEIAAVFAALLGVP